MRVDEPVDHVEFSDALEQIITKAKENNCDEYEILRELEAHTEKFVDNGAQYKQTFDWRLNPNEHSEDSYESDELRDRTGDSSN